MGCAGTVAPPHEPSQTRGARPDGAIFIPPARVSSPLQVPLGRAASLTGRAWVVGRWQGWLGGWLGGCLGSARLAARVAARRTARRAAWLAARRGLLAVTSTRCGWLGDWVGWAGGWRGAACWAGGCAAPLAVRLNARRGLLCGWHAARRGLLCGLLRGWLCGAAGWDGGGGGGDGAVATRVVAKAESSAAAARRVLGWR